MHVVQATPDDIDGFLSLAADVEDWFGPMSQNPKFRAALEKNIERATALVVHAPHDSDPGRARHQPVPAPMHRRGRHLRPGPPSFTTGQLNADDDQAWKTYTETLDQMGLADYVRVNQEAYEAKYK